MHIAMLLNNTIMHQKAEKVFGQDIKPKDAEGPKRCEYVLALSIPPFVRAFGTPI